MKHERSNNKGPLPVPRGRDGVRQRVARTAPCWPVSGLTDRLGRPSQRPWPSVVRCARA